MIMIRMITFSQDDISPLSLFQISCGLAPVFLRVKYEREKYENVKFEDEKVESMLARCMIGSSMSVSITKMESTR